MNLKLKTNSNVENLLVELQSSLQFSTKAAIMRLAIALSLKVKGDPRIVSNLLKTYDIKNQDGNEYLRYTILGNDDYLYKILFEQHLSTYIEEDDFFPEFVNAHIERGIKLLNSELKYAKNKDVLFKTIFDVKRDA